MKVDIKIGCGEPSDMPVGVWFIAKRNCDDEKVIVQRVRFTICGVSDAVCYFVGYGEESHIGYDSFASFLLQYTLVKQVDLVTFQ